MNNYNMSSSSKIASLELGRIVAIITILLMHCQVAMHYAEINGEPWLGFIINQIGRFAVPLFFIIAGYFIADKLQRAPSATLKAYARPLVRIWLIWSLISLLMPFNFGEAFQQGYLHERLPYWDTLLAQPLNSLFEGGLVHLWFIPGLVCALAILAACLHFGLDKAILPLALTLYIYGVLAGSYQQVSGLEAPIFTRNGPFFSTLLVASGYLIRQRQIQLAFAPALLLALLGMAGHFGEAALLKSYYQVPFPVHDFVFSTVVWGIGVFLMLMARPNWGQHPQLIDTAQMVLPFYILHLLVAIVMFNIAESLQLSGLSKDLMIVLGTLVLSVMLIKGIQQTRLNHILFR
jgi:surface polysaccharide O-acyltransferase-like enzyme